MIRIALPVEDLKIKKQGSNSSQITVENEKEIIERHGLSIERIRILVIKKNLFTTREHIRVLYMNIKPQHADP